MTTLQAGAANLVWAFLNQTRRTPVMEGGGITAARSVRE